MTVVRLAATDAEPAELGEVATVVARLVEPSRTPPSVPIALRVASGHTRGAKVGYNTPSSSFAVETDRFAGRMYFRFRGLSNEPTDGYFASRPGVRIGVVVQGQFKQPIVMSDCSTGYEFEKPFAFVPARFLVRSILRAVRLLAPTLVENVLGARPYVLNPLFQTVQLLHVAHPGSEPPIHNLVCESTSLLGGVFAERAVEATERKRYFASSKHGSLHMLDPALVYTLEFSEDKIDPTDFSFVILGMRFGIAKYLGRQPLPYPMAKLGHIPHEDTYFFNVHVWHTNTQLDTDI
jgi:hypothetical protein